MRVYTIYIQYIYISESSSTILHVGICICLRACVHAYSRVYVYVHMHTCMCIYTCKCMHTHTRKLHIFWCWRCTSSRQRLYAHIWPKKKPLYMSTRTHLGMPVIFMLTLPFFKAAAKGLLVKSPLNSACIAPMSVLLRERERERKRKCEGQVRTYEYTCLWHVCVRMCVYVYRLRDYRSSRP